MAHALIFETICSSNLFWGPAAGGVVIVKGEECAGVEVVEMMFLCQSSVLFPRLIRYLEAMNMNLPAR